MKEVLVKLRFIYARYLLISIGLILLYSIFRWYFDYKLGVIPLKETVLDYWLPFALSFVVVAIWLRKRMRCLNIGRENVFPLYYFLAAASIFIPIIISQEYIKTINSEFANVKSPYEITKARSTDYYAIEDYVIIKIHTGSYGISRTSDVRRGRPDNKLIYTMYMVSPMTDKSYQLDLKNHKYWYGYKYTEDMSNHISVSDKNKRWDLFRNKNFKKYGAFQEVEYLRGLSHSGDRDRYIEAIKSIREDINTDNLVILEPVEEQFVDDRGAQLQWTFGSFGIGAFVFLIMILIPSVNYWELEKYVK